MDPKKIVWRETGKVAIGQVLFLAAMWGVYALLSRFDRSVVLGGLVGAVLAVGNFFFMALGTSLAADRAEDSQDVKGGQALVRNSYFLRLLVLAVVLFACGKSGYFNLLALVLPLVFVRPTLTIAEFFRKKEDKSA